MTKVNLTTGEIAMLGTIISFYDEANNICYDCPLTPQEKGTVGSLVKKKLVYDSFEGEHNNGMPGQYDRHNFFPTDEAIELHKQLSKQ